MEASAEELYIIISNIIKVLGLCALTLEVMPPINVNYKILNIEEYLSMFVNMKGNVTKSIENMFF